MDNKLSNDRLRIAVWTESEDWFKIRKKALELPVGNASELVRALFRAVIAGDIDSDVIQKHAIK